MDNTSMELKMVIQNILLGFPAKLTGREDYCFYSGSFFFLLLLSPLARKR
jgi:hypothetical protein